MYLKKKNKKELPDDLIIEIARRLPAKSIGRFKCVSKEWNILLSSPEFVKSHLECASDGIILIDYCNSITYAVTQLATGGSSMAAEWKDEVNFLGSCNGLVLLVAEKANSESSFVVIFNPLTMRAIDLTDPLARCDLGYDVRYDLGYSSVDDDYKIAVMTRDDKKPKKVEIFSLKTQSFKKSADSLSLSLSYYCPGVCTGGRFYWLAYEEHGKASRTGWKYTITAFDLSTEKFEEVPLPTGFDLARLYCYRLVMIGGCLALSETPGCVTNQLDVWIMEKPEYWRKFTIANFPPDEHGRYCDQYYVTSRLGEFEFILTKNCTKVVAYNCETRVWRDLDIDGLPDLDLIALTFRESLVCPKSYV